MSDKITHLSNDTFKAAVTAAGAPVLVDFWAPWCGPCKAIAPILDELATELDGKLKICKVNVDEADTVAAEYGIRAIPTMLLFKGGSRRRADRRHDAQGRPQGEARRPSERSSRPSFQAIRCSLFVRQGPTPTASSSAKPPATGRSRPRVMRSARRALPFA
jgi:thioredoxin 1